MSSKKYAAPLRLDPQPSRRLAFFLAASFAGAAALPFLVAVSLGLRLIVLAVIAAVAYDAYVRHFGARRIVRAVWDEMDQWRLYLADGTEEEDARLEGDSVVTPEVMMLNFRAGRRRFCLVVPGDTLDGETHRRLRVRLRMEARRRAAVAAKRESDPVDALVDATGKKR